MKVVTCITATRGRHKCIERVVDMMTKQNYQGKFYHLIYNNHPQELTLDPNLDPEKFILVNNSIDKVTGKEYTNLGAIYRDAITYVPEDTDIINFMDDDDMYSLNHISEGVAGYERGGKLGYKPKKSYYKGPHGAITLVENTMEPSIFVNFGHVKQYGFSEETTAQHLLWVNGLVYNNQISVDPDGPSTLTYDWSQEIPTFKTSGNPMNPHNFQNYTNYSNDNGDLIISAKTAR